MPKSEAQSSRYSHLERYELIRLLEQRDGARKLGLVWERDEIERDRALNDDYVALQLDEDLSHGPAPFQNLLIEGENYDALRMLRATYAGKIKVIAIDPPYNTGGGDFVYNDRYVDPDDRYRHSLWLEHMHRRLTLARDLLRRDGVIMVHIGEEEHARLALLMDQVFPRMKVGTFVWRTRQGSNDSSGAFFSQDHEYVICYAGPDFAFGGHEKSETLYSNPDGDDRGAWKSADLTKAHTHIQRPNTYYPICNPNSGVWYPCNPDSVWRYATRSRVKPGQKLRTRTMEEMIGEGRILWPKDDRSVTYQTRKALLQAIEEGSAPFVLRADLPDLDDLVGKPLGFGRPQAKRFLEDRKKTTQPLSSWIVATLAKQEEKETQKDEREVIVSGTYTEGTAALQDILKSKAFTYPKPPSLMRALIAQATRADGNDIVLDFYAGSGTTAQAVLELNEADDGNRHFILCSSTEATAEHPTRNICREVTRQRLLGVMLGYTPRKKGSGRHPAARVAGLDGAFAYLRTVRIPLLRVREDITHDQVWLALQLLHGGSMTPSAIEEGLFWLRRETGDIAYVPDVDARALAALTARVVHRRPSTVYSWRPGVLAQRFEGSGITFAKIPDALVESMAGTGDRPPWLLEAETSEFQALSA